jgi:hypothetical protein
LTIVKQIALENINGMSIGKQRSYPSNIDGIFFHYYPNDVFFIWGKDSYNKFKKKKNYTKEFLLSGYPYPVNKSYNKDRIQNYFNSDVKFKILLIDNKHDLNKSVTQVIYTKDLCNFYNKFFELASNDSEIGLIIKSKRYSNFRELKNIQEISKKLEEKKQCLIIRDTHQLATNNVAEGADLSVGISVYPPAAFLESLLSCKGIYYDYSNIFFKDTFFYEGKDKIIFNNLEILISKIIDYKNANLVDLNYANWSKLAYRIDHFRDTFGHIRIGGFISELKRNFDKSLISKIAIKEATYNYKKKWYKNNNLND